MNEAILITEKDDKHIQQAKQSGRSASFSLFHTDWKRSALPAQKWLPGKCSEWLLDNYYRDCRLRYGGRVETGSFIEVEAVQGRLGRMPRLMPRPIPTSRPSVSGHDQGTILCA
ncbi:hypothetical protein BBD39_05650 [Arsenophonus endosymbiont of Bemisia tabaci Asia II 3]|nr:hypothetical protein BBD39_05650 [Arsenophonus endosymbiont of Bemisia tabaci Asia II 3]